MTDQAAGQVCVQASPYYYDFLTQTESNGHVPELLFKHITECTHCQSEVRRLDSILQEVEGETNDVENSRRKIVTSLLDLHFAQTGRPVTCDCVKPLLPTLAGHIPRITIDTPITTHIDNCSDCRADLLKIKGLNLLPKQLYRLGQFFADDVDESSVKCRDVKRSIGLIVAFGFGNSEIETLRHICLCPDCRKTMFDERETLILDLKAKPTLQEASPCDFTSDKDIFDYCFPYGMDPENDQYANFRPAFTYHMSQCPECLSKMQKLHLTISEIIERPESDVVTGFTLEECQSQQESQNDSFDLVGMQIPKKQHTLIQKVTRPGSHARLRRRLVPAAIAAMLFISIGLLFNTSTAKAVTLEQVFNAVAKIKNVCVTRFATGKSEPLQKVWTSQSLNIKLYEMPKVFVLWDINKSQKWHCDRASETISITAVPGDMLIKVQKSIDNSFGMFPFSDISDVPQNASWTKVDGASLKGYSLADIEVYDLDWTTAEINNTVDYRKWRVFVDSKTDLPKRTEYFFKRDPKDEYAHESTTIVEYTDENTVMAVITTGFNDFESSEDKHQLLNN